MVSQQPARRLISDVRPPQTRRAVVPSSRRTHYQHHTTRRATPSTVVSDFLPTKKEPTAPSTTQPTAQATSSKPSSTHVRPRHTHTSHKHKPRDPKHLTVAGHISEFRKRLLWSVLALMAGGILGYIYHDQIIAVLVKPLNQQLYYTSPTGGFDFLIKTCLFFGFLLAVPILVYNLLKFITPAIPPHITYKTGKILFISSLLALAGVAFAYFISLPAALHFLNNFSTGPVTSLISANEYFTFVMIYMAGFAALFQMPLIIAFINKVTPLTPKLLMQKQRFVILGSFIIAAILTPTPDPMNQTLMAIPIVMLYQSSIGVVWHSNRRSQKRPMGSYAQPVAATA